MATKRKAKTEPAPKRISKKEEVAAWAMQRRWNCLQMAAALGLGTDYNKVTAAADVFCKFVESGMLGRAGPKLVTSRDGTEPPQAA